MFTLQRATGVFFSCFFIAWHIFQTRIQKALGAEVEFNMIADIVANPVMACFLYLQVFFSCNVPL